MKYKCNILVNKYGEKVNFSAARLQFTSMKYSYKSGEKVDFFAASLQFTGMKYRCNILVNKYGEKVNFFAARLQFTSTKYSYKYTSKQIGRESQFLCRQFAIYWYEI